MESSTSVAIIVLALIIVLVVKVFIANEFCTVAEEKGYDEEGRKYFWIPFLLGITGYLLIIALPDRKKDQEKNTLDKDSVHDELPEL